MKKAIEIEGFSFGIGGKGILRDVSLSVEEGDYVSIVGPNGAGKTTLLKCLARILTGGTGCIKVDGSPLGDYSQKGLAKLMGYVPQAGGRLSPFTVYEFVMMGRYPHLSPFSRMSAADEHVVREALELTGTEKFADRSLGTLSGGEQQKVFIAAALAQGTKILLLDEPTTFLDPRHQADVQNILWRLNNESSVTILAATHDINAAVLSSRQVVALKDGAVAFSGGGEEIMNNETLERIYQKTFLFVRHPQTGLPIIVPEGMPS